MPAAGPVMQIDVSGETPAGPAQWTVNITVKLKTATGVIVAPSGSVDVTLKDLGEVPPNSPVSTIGTKPVDASGKASFTVDGAYYSFGYWYANLYSIFAKHKATGATVEVWVWLDSQLGDGVLAFPWDPFPTPEASRQWQLV